MEILIALQINKGNKQRKEKIKAQNIRMPIKKDY
jgi:hypothetical protein